MAWPASTAIACDSSSNRPWAISQSSPKSNATSPPLLPPGRSPPGTFALAAPQPGPAPKRQPEVAGTGLEAALEIARERHLAIAAGDSESFGALDEAIARACTALVAGPA